MRPVPPDVAQMPQYRLVVRSHDPLIVSWQGRQVRVRHDDPHLGPYTPRGAVIRSAMDLAQGLTPNTSNGPPLAGRAIRL